VPRELPKLWVSPPRTHCIFGPRKEAVVFRTQMQAEAVIETLAEECKRYGFLLEVARTPCEPQSWGPAASSPYRKLNSHPRCQIIAIQPY
jgi:hypothetical protein